MLFDLRGRGRRSTVRVIYIGLALLMGIGLVGFGIGTGVGGGGLFSAAEHNEGSGGVSFSAEIKRYEKLTRREPSNVAAWEKLIEAQLHEAGGEAYVTRTGVTKKGKELYGAIASSWNSYLALNPPHPNVSLAKDVLLIFGEEGLNQPAAAVQVLQIIVAAEPNSTHYYSFLADYAYKSHNTRVGDLALEKALSLAPEKERSRLRRELEAVKKNPSGEEVLTGTTNGKAFTVKPSGEGRYKGTISTSTTK